MKRFLLGCILGAAATFLLMRQGCVKELIGADAKDPAAPAPVAGCQVTPVFDEDYFPALHETLQGARKSVRVVMYRASYGKNPKHRERILIEDLVDAHRRGVKVEMVLDANKTYWEADASKRGEIEAKNEEAIARLKEAGVPVFVDSLDTVTHSKLVIVDGEWVFLGSANWTGAALKDNHEANVRIRSKELATRLTEAVAKIERKTPE